VFRRFNRAASVAAYMPVSRFLERKARLTLERVDFAIAKWTSDDGKCGVCVDGGGGGM
jgi:hypothetical protein